MTKAHDDRALEREYVTSQISLRELCRRHGITAHSLVTIQARKGRWAEKREAYQARESESFIEKHAERMAAREAGIRDHALEAIDEVITKFRADLKSTRLVRQPDGTIVEVPAMTITPRDVAILIDRLGVLFGRPSAIREERSLSLTSEVPADALREFIEATRGLGGPPSLASPLPRSPRRLDD